MPDVGWIAAMVFLAEVGLVVFMCYQILTAKNIFEPADAGFKGKER